MILSIGKFTFLVILWFEVSSTKSDRYLHLSKWISTTEMNDTGAVVFDWRLRVSVKQCMDACNVTKACQFFNYETQTRLCGLIRTGTEFKTVVGQKPGYVYGNKSEWTQNTINRCDKCDNTGMCNNNDLNDNNNEFCYNSGCEALSGGKILGNMFSSGNKIKTNVTKCKEGYTRLPIGITTVQQTCMDNGSWSSKHSCFRLVPYGDTYLFMYQVNQTWMEAKAFCESYGAHLVDIKSEDKQTAVELLIMSEKDGGKMSYWSGGNDMDEEGIWRWSDLTLMVYKNWHGGDPDNFNEEEHCLIIEEMTDNFEWRDRYCFDVVPCICEL